MTLGSGPFRSREEAKQPSDWQKYANRSGFEIFVLCALFLTLTFAAGTVLWIAAEFFTCVVWIIAGKEEEIRLLLQKQVSKASIAKIVDVTRPTIHRFIKTRRLRPHP
jgi:hypothetical protein